MKGDDVVTETEFIKDFGFRLRAELDYSWTSQKDLAEMTGIAESTISYYIRGERMPSIKNVINIARALECEVSDLIELNGTIE